MPRFTKGAVTVEADRGRNATIERGVWPIRPYRRATVEKADITDMADVFEVVREWQQGQLHSGVAEVRGVRIDP